MKRRKFELIGSTFFEKYEFLHYWYIVENHISLLLSGFLKEPADLVTFTEEILKAKLHFLCSENPNHSY